MVVQCSYLIDHMEALVFDNGHISVGPLSEKILERKGCVWIHNVVGIGAADCY